MTDDEPSRAIDDVSNHLTESRDLSDSVQPTAHQSSNWKVLGETDATDGVGVLGHGTSGSGETTGVAGFVDSSTTGAAGVEGQAKAASGQVYGVQGVNFSEEPASAGVQAASLGGRGLVSYSPDGFGATVWTETATNHGLEAFNNATKSTSGSGYGILGETFSLGDGAAGVAGQASATTGKSYGVHGETASPLGGAAGVRGEATAGSGVTIGVDGVSRSESGVGMRGRATNANATFAYGVTGETEATGAVLVNRKYFSAGVTGTAQAASGNAVATAGVAGYNQATSGTGHGVLGSTGSHHVDAAGVRARSTSGATGISAQSTSGVGMRVTGVSPPVSPPAPDGHAALIEDSGSAITSVLALKTGESGPDANNNLVTFYDGTDAALGSIEGDGGGGVSYTSGAADFAEYLPRLDPAEDLEAGDLVGLVDGAVTKRTAEADQAFVVSDQPVVTGNAPGATAEARADHATVALVGQVAARVAGEVETGDIVVPSGDHDGTGRAIDPARWTPGRGPIVGRALEGSDEQAPSAVTVAVGLETGEAVAPALGDHDERLGSLERANEDLRAELDRKDEVIEDLTTAVEALRRETERLRAEKDALADRLGTLDERVETLEGGAARVTSADD